MKVYDIALYVEGPPADLARLRAEAASKVMRVEVRYQDDSRRPLPIDWRRELVPQLEAAGTAHLRATAGTLRQGDVLLIEYVPGKGTTVRVNKTVAVAGVSHDLMLTFLNHWLESDPSRRRSSGRSSAHPERARPAGGRAKPTLPLGTTSGAEPRRHVAGLTRSLASPRAASRRT